MILRLCAYLPALALLATGCVADTSADTQASSSAFAGGRDHRPPPQESIDACAPLSVGDACSFDIDGRHIDGTCKAPPPGAPSGAPARACVPDHPPLPQEAIDACASSAAGDTCSFTINGHDIDGTCKAPPAGAGSNAPSLACAPDHPPIPQEAIDACASSAAGDTCSFTINGHDIDGTCKSPPFANGVVACAPTNPPPH